MDSAMIAVCLLIHPGLISHWLLYFRDGVFTVSIDLSPGEYLYKYYVDSEWQIRKDQVQIVYTIEAVYRFCTALSKSFQWFHYRYSRKLTFYL